MESLKLESLRGKLIRQEETIIFALIERAQFKRNSIIYSRGGITIDRYDGSFLDYLLWQTERNHAEVRRYTSPDEHPFSTDLPEPILPVIEYPEIIRKNSINVNPRIYSLYLESFIPKICASGDDGNYGSSATCDVPCLQALSKRIHYGKFIAEAKFQEDPVTYTQLIKAGNCDDIINRLTNHEVEERLFKRVALKAQAYGRDIGADHDSMSYKIKPDAIASMYREWIIPLTKEVEIQYLLQRIQNDESHEETID